jgi:iron complex outermembrane recepter protein
MRISMRSMAVIVSGLAAADLALAQTQEPSETQESSPPASTAPTLPKVEVIAPKKKAAPPSTATPAEKGPSLPKLEVIAAPKKKVSRPPPAPVTAAPAAAPTVVEVPRPPAAPAWAGAFEVPMSPTGGSELPVDKVPAGISVINSSQIERVGSPSITEAINTYVPSATINEALGNGLATDLQYRGFTASPLNGTPQGLAIYQNGVRLNEVFGDAMNWDLIPQIAIADIVMMSNNPAYGLNALGGAVNVIMKNGFGFQGATVDTRLGSFGHKEVAAEAGQKWGNWATYVAGEWIDDNGWRDLSSAEAKRVYSDLGFRVAPELHLRRRVPRCGRSDAARTCGRTACQRVHLAAILRQSHADGEPDGLGVRHRSPEGLGQRLLSRL